MLPRLVLLLPLVLTTFGVGLPQACGLTISNGIFSVDWEEQTQQIELLPETIGRKAVRIDLSQLDRFAAKVVEVTDKTFGPGQAIELDAANGNLTQLQVFRDLPFVLVVTQLHNATSAKQTKNHIPFASLQIDRGIPESELKTFGSGGLLDVDENPGSYAWLAVVDPRTRQGVVAGWITHDQGCGVLFSRSDAGKCFVDARLDYGQLAIPAEGAVTLETFAVGYFADARLGLESWADAIAKKYDIRLPPQPAGYCTWYSDPHGGASDEAHLAELADFGARAMAQAGFDFVQIDDKWQAGESTNGPRRNFTTHDPQGPYPSGMKRIAEKVKSLGLKPGIWFMPFAGTFYDPFYKEHQEWFVKTTAGEPYETKWGGTCLDMTQPGAREHVRSVVHRISQDWGFQYFKIDGLWTGSGTPLRYINRGYVDDGIGDAVFSTPDKPNIEIYRDGLKLVREAAGPEVFILGCNTPQNMRTYGASMGVVNAMRIGPDNGPEWKHLLMGPRFGSRHYFLHGRVWYNDPDPVYVRESMPLNHAQLICSWVAISGQLFVNSDWLPGLPHERLDILRRTMASHGLHSRPVDLFEYDPPRLWSLSETDPAHRNVIGVFNWDSEPRDFELSYLNLGLSDEQLYDSYDFWNDEFLPAAEGPLKLTLPAESCKILALLPMSDHPQLLSTSGHVSQGIVDVLEEKWSDTDDTLRGRSRLLGSDEYELRVVVPDLKWKAILCEAKSAANESLSSSFAQEGRLIKMSFLSPPTGKATWTLRFRRQESAQD